MRKLLIKCSGTRDVEFNTLKNFQGNLKSMSEGNTAKLCAAILDNGFRIPLFVWGDKIIDGHQRVVALQKIQSSGVDIPRIPVVDIQAKTEEEARKVLLLLNSRYGDFSSSAFQLFSEGMSREFLDALRLPDVKIISDPHEEPDVEELKPYKWHHVLVSVAHSDIHKIAEYIDRMKTIEGVRVE